MTPLAWGTLFHDMLMFVAINYSNNPSITEQMSMTSLITEFVANLPCLACMVHSSIYIQTHPPDIHSGTSLTAWVVGMHNDINEKLGKKSDWTVSEAIEAFNVRHFSNVSVLSRSEQKRLEDHNFIETCTKEITRLQILNSELVQALSPEEKSQYTAGDSSNRNSSLSTTELTILIILVVCVLLFMLLAVILYRRRTPLQKKTQLIAPVDLKTATLL
jgi:hypothetical protein